MKIIPNFSKMSWAEIALTVRGVGAGVTALGIATNNDLSFKAIPTGLNIWALMFWFWPQVDANGNLSPPILTAWTFKVD